MATNTKSLPRFLRSRGGNVTMIFALAAPVLLFGTAVAVDFTNATVVRSKLNAAADAAALAALTPAMMQQSDAIAGSAATAMFNARASAIGSISTGNATAIPVITHPGGNMNIRQITITYTAASNTIFSGILGQKTLGVGGTSTAQASIPPNIDFYLLLDNSPSMSLPAAQAGITQMQNLTPKQEGGVGCAFACHQASTNNGDTAGNPCSDGSAPTLSSNTYCAATNAAHQPITQIDNYALARKNGITLRLDELSSGVATLMNTANGYQTSGIYSTPPVYRFAAYEMDSSWAIGVTNTLLMTLNTNYVSGWSSSSGNFGVMQMYANNITCGTAACTTPGTQGDVATNYDNAMNDINNTLPSPGNGTNIPGDKPQEVMFFVTDGVEDEQNINRLIQPINGGSSTNYCSMIKARGIKIAILYTEYLPVPSNSFYQGNVAPFQANIGPSLSACASPGLYYDAAIGADLGKALASLFNAVVQQAALSN